MKQRPISVTVLAWVYIAAGAVGFAYHLKDFTARPFQFENLWIEFVRILAIVSGAYMLRGKNWARWLAMAWIAFHVAISFFHSWGQLAMHAAVLVTFAVVLFRRPATEYFRGAGSSGNDSRQ
jgi:hypothetical protein